MTNTELCVWDGGDCCLDRSKKDTTLCQTCTCKVSVDKVKLRDTFKNTQVMMLQDQNDFQRLILKTERTVVDVNSGDVCSALCLDFPNTVNGWKFNNLTSTCTCSWLKSTECIEKMAIKDVNFFDDFDEDQAVNVAAYIQMNKTVSCSKC